MRRAGPGIGANDPVVAPPIYGSWHAGVERVKLPAEDPGWVPAINLDPALSRRRRASARASSGKNQDAYMRSAWEQIGDVLTVNATIRRAQLADEGVVRRVSQRRMVRARVEPAIALASPVFKKVMGSPTTLHALVTGSRLPRAALSPAFRKMVRPRGRLARRCCPPDARMDAITTLVQGINDGSLSAAPPPPPPVGATLEGVTDAIRPPAWVAWLLRNAWWLAHSARPACPVALGGVRLGRRARRPASRRRGARRGVRGRSQQRPAVRSAELFEPCATHAGGHRSPCRRSQDYVVHPPADDPLRHRCRRRCRRCLARTASMPPTCGVRSIDSHTGVLAPRARAAARSRRSISRTCTRPR